MLTWTAKQPHDRPPMTIGSSFLGRSSMWNCGERLNVTIAMKAFQLKNNMFWVMSSTRSGEMDIDDQLSLRYTSIMSLSGWHVERRIR